ncbi:MAG: transposase [Gemmatimonadales bacterium]
MVRRQRRYDRDYKLEAVRLACEEGRRVRDVAETMGVEVKLLYRWVGDRRPA